MTITTQFDGPYVANSGTITGWWPGASTAFTPPEFGSGGTMPGVIVGGADDYANSTPDGRTSRVSVYGFSAEYDEFADNQSILNTAFINLVNYILGTSWGPEEGLNDAKLSLINAGFYYQYPVSFQGQSPNTGDGSDVL